MSAHALMLDDCRHAPIEGFFWGCVFGVLGISLVYCFFIMIHRRKIQSMRVFSFYWCIGVSLFL